MMIYLGITYDQEKTIDIIVRAWELGECPSFVKFSSGPNVKTMPELYLEPERGRQFDAFLPRWMAYGDLYAYYDDDHFGLLRVVPTLPFPICMDPCLVE